MDHEDKTGMLIKYEKYLEAGIHIGTKMCTNDMKKYVYKKREDGLHILDIKTIDQKLREAIKLLSNYKPEDIVIVASRTYSSNAAQKLSAIIGGIKVIKGRFVPGTFTNISLENFCEPKIILVCDPKNESQAVKEAGKIGIPIVALCDTDNDTKFIDLIVPCNNKGRKSLATIFYILTRELMISYGKIKTYDQFPYTITYFEELEEEQKSKTQTTSN